MKRLYVYILECADDSFYVGVTNNVGRRFIEHINGVHENSYTFNRRPLKLVFCKEFNRPIMAIKYEKQVKALINHDFKQLHELAKCKNATTHNNFMVRVSEAER
jgi:putative endonuclease